MEASDVWDFVSALFISAGMLVKALILAVAPAVATWWLTRRDKEDPP